MHRTLSFGLLAACMLTLVSAPPVSAEPKTPECLDRSMPASDVELRGARITVSQDRRWVGITACIVSRLDRLQEVGVTFAAFDDRGVFLGANGQFLGDLSKTNTEEGGLPQILVPSGASFVVALEPDRSVDDLVLMTVKWRPCVEVEGAQGPFPQCRPATPRTDTYLVKAKPGD